MNYTQTMKLDIRDNHTYEQLYVKQYDKGYQIVFEITKDAEAFDLTGATASFEMFKPDGNIILYSDCVVSGNTVTIVLTDQMTAADGKGKFQLSLTQGNKQITTITGIMWIDQSTVSNSAIESTSALSIIVEAIEYSKQAIASAEAAALSESSARSSATKSQSYAEGGTGSRCGENTDNSKYYNQQAGASASNAGNSEVNALTYSRNASASASNAATSESNARTSATNAATSATNASASEVSAKASEEQALYYYQECQRIASELGEIIVPMGTIYFAQLASQDKVAGHMFNIIDAFVTDNSFREGAGISVPAGSNVYCTADLLWDVMAGAGVSGVKGDAESTYRNGNVNITKANIGLGNVENKSSATIRSETTKANVTDALGYTPVNVIYSETEPTTQLNGDWWFKPYT